MVGHGKPMTLCIGGCSRHTTSSQGENAAFKGIIGAFTSVL